LFISSTLAQAGWQVMLVGQTGELLTMGQNKAQREAAARAKKSVTPEAERTREGSDNPAAIQAKMDEVAAQPKPTGTAVPATQPAVDKQQLAIMQLSVALRQQRQIEVKPDMLKQDGKYINLVVGKEWPTIRIGNSGGITVMELKSYAKAFDAAVNGDTLYAKQKGREQKKVAASAPPAAPKADEKQTVTA
jgi:hypothetical protein